MILKTEAELEKYNLVNRVFHLDKDTYLYGNLEANVAPVYTALVNNYERVDFMKFDVDVIHSAITRMASQGAFIENQQYLGVFNSVFADEQFQRKDTGAARAWVIDELVKRGWWPPTVEAVSQILIDAWNQLPDNQNFRENKEATDRRNSQIAEMTNGEYGTPDEYGKRPRPSFSIWRGSTKIAFDKNGRVFDAMDGQAQGFGSKSGGSLAAYGPWSRGAGSKSFDEMTNEEVDALYNEYKTTSDLRNMSVEDLRKLVKANGPTDVFNKNVRVPSVAAPDGDVLLENPAKPGTEFTRRDLIAYADAHPYNARNLITRNGRIVPRLRQRFEDIWNGLRG